MALAMMLRAGKIWTSPTWPPSPRWRTPAASRGRPNGDARGDSRLRRSLGVTLLPRFVAGGHEAAGKMCCHPVPAPFAAVETMLASHRDGVPSAVLRALNATISAMQAIDRSQRE